MNSTGEIRHEMLTRRFLVAAIVTVSTLLAFVSSCTTTFTLPSTDGETERLYLLSYSTWGHHSLAFLRGEQLVEFTYVDWDLFALLLRDPWTAWKNMTFRTQGALGRKVVLWEDSLPLCSLFNDCLRAASFLAQAQQSRALYERLA